MPCDPHPPAAAPRPYAVRWITPKVRGDGRLVGVWSAWHVVGRPGHTLCGRPLTPVIHRAERTADPGAATCRSCQRARARRSWGG